MKALYVVVVLVALLSIATVPASAAKVPPGPIKHFIVLMMENRAFDHMLGWMHEENPKIIGLNGTQSNPWDFSNPHGKRLYVTKTPNDVTPSPDHSINGTSTQIFGNANPQPWDQPTMQGFVKSARSYIGDAYAQSVMDAWPPEHVPVISSLARNFALFDSYHASVPGPTDINRLYLHSATSHGEGHNNIVDLILGYPQKNLYQLLDEAGYNWRAYFGEVPDPLFFQYTRAPEFWDRFHLIEKFYSHVASGDPYLHLYFPQLLRYRRYFGQRSTSCTCSECW